MDIAPVEVQKMITRRKNTWILRKDGYHRASKGAFYCLSDGVPKEKWTLLHQWDAQAETEQITGILGFTAVWNSSSLYPELKRFIQERKPATIHLLEEVLIAGIPIGSMVGMEDWKACEGPLLICNPEFYRREELEALEEFDAAPMVLLGYECPLRRLPDGILSESEQGLKLFYFNCGAMGGRRRELGKKRKAVSRSFRDAHGGIWDRAAAL